MSSLPQLACRLEHLLTTLPDEQGRACGFIRRQRTLTAALFVQVLVLGWLSAPTASLAQLTQTAAALGVRLSPQGLAKRFTPAAARLLEAVLTATVERAVAASPVEVALLRRFAGVLVLDSTTISLPAAHAGVWPGCGGRAPHQGRAALKVSVLLDELTGRLELTRAPGRAQDRASRLQHAPLAPGVLRIADRGFWSLAVFHAIGQSDAFWLSHHHLQVRVFGADGRPLELGTWLAAQQPERVEAAVLLGQGARLPARLLAERTPEVVAETRRRAIRAAARRAGKPPSPAALRLAAWTLVVTNAPAERLSHAEALVLLRSRWQIELLFKLWKSGGQLACSRSAQPERVLCEVTAKLIALVLQHWLLLTGLWADPARSLVRGAQTVRAHAITLALAFGSRRALIAALRALMGCLARLTPQSKRRTHPSTAQLLADPALTGLS
jgi:hypothetical protein